jgi:hypothetical protein
MAKKRIAAVILFILMLLSLSYAANAACGTILSNTVLSSNQSSPGTCYTIGADSITLDCAGFWILGTGAGDGVLVKTRQDVTIKNCNIQNFVNGINITDSNRTIINNTNISAVTNGIFIDPSEDTDVDGGSMDDCSIAVNADESHNGNFNVRASGNFIFGSSSSGNTIYDSTISGTLINNGGPANTISNVGCANSLGIICSYEFVLNHPYATEFMAYPDTTEFSGAGNLANTDVTLSNGNTKVSWLGVNAANADYDLAVEIGNNFVAVDKSLLDISHGPATVTLGVDNCNNFALRYSSDVESSADHVVDVVATSETLASGDTNLAGGVGSNLACVGGKVTFDVITFSSYATGQGTDLTIWDETDTGGEPYSGQTRIANQLVRFFANYSNATSGASITGASCNISFDEAPTGPTAMMYNATTTYYEFNRSFTTAGAKNWYVNCSAVNYAALNTSDTALISAVTPEFGTYALMLALFLVVGGFFYIRSKKL